MQFTARFSPKHSQAQAGFTLIELVVVIIVLGILAVIAAPKFLNLSVDAQVAQVKNTGGAFKSGINLARSVWAVKVGSGPAENLPVYGDSDDAHVDFNANGWPAQHYFTDDEASPQLDNVDDCISVWQVILQNDEPTVSDATKADETDYKAIYNEPAACTYQYTDNTNLSITYDSNNGSVVVDSDPTS
ncbi:pilus assembly FimT family protein [Shewanella pneumatophori]|uniref:Prepilin-type N-terminal cleavage/methylation domain-containing protein n=1 Tax=Shewanella pneumatophori TaxID=314092 RepID=A0A9X1ZEA8_9GAMM|nr:prepilin-type N-terminal cleavage/methylation domain-containing protein [Shewanella pneumatophori]MCL1137815.1 prepilin-type N-terminal cleavage/methylation domain-containing protein [Shewanella pneumatophori]